MNSGMISPVIDAEAMNTALFAERNPRAALLQVRVVAGEVRQMIRNGASKEEVFAKLNRIVMLTGGV